MAMNEIDDQGVYISSPIGNCPPVGTPEGLAKKLWGMTAGLTERRYLESRRSQLAAIRQ